MNLKESNLFRWQVLPLSVVGPLVLLIKADSLQVLLPQLAVSSQLMVLKLLLKAFKDLEVSLSQMNLMKKLVLKDLISDKLSKLKKSK